MFTPEIRLRSAAVRVTMAAALIGLGAGAANASGWPPLQEGAYLYSGSTGTGTVSKADLDDVGTCHTLSQPALSVQIASGSAYLVLYSEADCTATYPWSTGTLARTSLPWAMLSYRVVKA
ncbi:MULTISPECIES: hypothetical protein [Streptomyces]|uniref:hypothetical protein n=1 Tax=Streptomyces TaxID=1883 RepID=UPI0023DD65E1|nr:hypothetical protein [Streptomyces sp. FXJ1.172]WEP00835.1 hypothetical protein A6P39_042460 [Streptomyces sp. FXJ1.172]